MSLVFSLELPVLPDLSLLIAWSEKARASIRQGTYRELE